MKRTCDCQYCICIENLHLCAIWLPVIQRAVKRESERYYVSPSRRLHIDMMIDMQQQASESRRYVYERQQAGKACPRQIRA